MMSDLSQLTTATNNLKGKTDLSIVSWNINDSRDKFLGDKSDNADFLDILAKHDIICLQETKGNIKIPNFRCYNKLRKGSRSGGLCIGIRSDLMKHLKIMNTDKFSEDFQAAKISKNLTGLSVDVVIINVYDSPENSSFKMKKKKSGTLQETLSELDSFMLTISSNSSILMMGDFNARTGSNNSIALDSDAALQQLCDNSFSTRSHPLPTSRTSKDDVTNSRGTKLLDFASEWNVSVMNGGVIGDIQGEWTCMLYNGSSVVDYVLASHDLKCRIRSLKVTEFNEFSDHRPLSYKVKLCTSFMSPVDISKEFSDTPLGFTWKAGENNSKKSYLKNQRDEDAKSTIIHVAGTECNNTSDVYEMNRALTKAIMEIARKSLSKRRPPKKRWNKNSWYDDDCRRLKRNLRKHGKSFSKSPLNEDIRKQYYLLKKEYRNTLKLKKYTFFANLNKDIEDNNNIKWDNFKSLKMKSSDSDKLDLYDLSNFYKFFKDLYSEKSLPDDKTDEFRNSIGRTTTEEADNPTTTEAGNLSDLLNEDITLEEVNNAIAKLKRGKAVSEDCIANEFLIYATDHLRAAIHKLFNECLKHGTYPWNTSLITPLHKKGDRYNPDNYRAIAVGSNMGKLFAGVLLQRLIRYRAICCPDPPNQLGFCKGAQTADHIFTLTTSVRKYLSAKKRVYSCFIDYRKAFDTVCREALLYKLSRLGIGGRFFNCMHHMYLNSKAKIKLLGKLSHIIDVLIGTEQGHPMSPELFKCYLIGLSEDLNSNLSDLDLLDLNGMIISHLLWADDLVLLALSKESLQLLIDRVHAYCEEWGLTVNLSKTAVMVFSNSGRQLQESYGFKFGSETIPSTKMYCYLGIVFSLTGSFTKAQDELRKKGLRAYFSLKRLIDLNQLTSKSVFRLFDALILPVCSYGCQVWLPSTAFFKMMALEKIRMDSVNSLKNLAKEPLEQIHLKFLKWTMSVHKKTINLACWGDSGRMPLVLTLSKQVLDYFNRLKAMDTAKEESLVRHAFVEQRTLNLEWYNNVNKAANILKNGSQNESAMTGIQFKKQAKELFQELWCDGLAQSSKLKFYASIKSTIGYEPYLSIKGRDKRSAVAKLRCSSHRLRIETGRYTLINRTWNKCCTTCTADEAEDFLHLPFADPILEDEAHVLVTCPLYHHIRTTVPEPLLCSILRWDWEELFYEGNVKEFASYISRIFRHRDKIIDHV
jgi:exonuclease III